MSARPRPQAVREQGATFTFTGELPPEVLDQIVQRATAAAVEELRLLREPWLDVEQAAAYLACPKSRIYDLVQLRRLRHAKDGRNLKFRREWLDQALEHDPNPDQPRRRP